MTDTERGFLNAILERPGDDLPRLVYCDWLDENAGEVECGCDDGAVDTGAETPWGDPISEQCGWCSGSGRVSNGFAERSEFIRVQCELAGIDSRTDSVKRWNDLRKRERELWMTATAREWFLPLPGTAHVAGSAPRTYIAALYGEIGGQREKIEYHCERGFPAEVRAPLAVLVGGECERCGGNGTIERRVYHFEPEGRVVGWDDCDPCHGTGMTPGIAAKISREQPVTRWVATDKEPVQVSGGWEYHVSDRPDARNAIPWRLAEMNDAELCTTFPTREAAIDALSAAIATLAKSPSHPIANATRAAVARSAPA